ncbi:AraC family transcriptional regulator [Rhodobacteraceae bacterium D3-12]|nr:AraC family transcriptional regulator [Rhodobacteraceae bacterium D3-12]
MRAAYEKRMIRVLEYIHTNPDGDLSLDRLADVAAMSRFHWHRVFHAMTGETCAQAVRRIRLNRAACWLLRKPWPVEEVAKRVGYPSVQSFGRAFRAAYGMSPVQFRTNGAEAALQLMKREGQPDMFDVVIEDAPERALAVMRHRGPYIEIGNAFEQASAMIGARNLWGQVRTMVGVYFDDPSSVPEAELRSMAGYELEDGVDLPDGFEAYRIAGGPVGRLRYRGPYAGMQQAYDYLYSEWLPGSGRDPGDAPAFEVYLNTPADVAPADLLTDICLPLRP